MKIPITDWLHDYLAEHGPSRSEDVKDSALAAGYSRHELKEARYICGVKADSVVYWCLPEDKA